MLIISYLFLVSALFGSCLSFKLSSKYPLHVATIPSDASIRVYDHRDKVIYDGYSPAIVTVRAGRGFFRKSKYRIVLNHDAYQTQSFPIQIKWSNDNYKNPNSVGLVNLIAIVDVVTGANYALVDQTLTLNLGQRN